MTVRHPKASHRHALKRTGQGIRWGPHARIPESPHPHSPPRPTLWHAQTTMTVRSGLGPAKPRLRRPRAEGTHHPHSKRQESLGPGRGQRPFTQSNMCAADGPNLYNSSSRYHCSQPGSRPPTRTSGPLTRPHARTTPHAQRQECLCCVK